MAKVIGTLLQISAENAIKSALSIAWNAEHSKWSKSWKFYFLDCKYGFEERRQAEFLGLDYKNVNYLTKKRNSVNTRLLWCYTMYSDTSANEDFFTVFQTRLTNVLVDARANIKRQTWTVGPFQELKRSSINFGQIFDFCFSKETEASYWRRGDLPWINFENLEQQ